MQRIRSYLKKQWPPVTSARGFAQRFGLVRGKGNEIRLTSVGERILRFTNMKRVEFSKAHWRLQDKEPFPSLLEPLRREQSVSVKRLGELLKVKFVPAASWTKDDYIEYGRGYSKWLAFLGLVDIKNDEVTYVGGEVVAYDITALPELEFLPERHLYDWLVESFHTPKNLLDEPTRVLEQTNSERDDRKRGRLFEEFVAVVGARLGFSPKRKAGPRESKSRLTFKSTRGGGDVALMWHFPVSTVARTYHGGALACEVKSTTAQIGSSAIGQARNLRKKILEFYPDYVVQPLVLSRSEYGYDASGRDQAPPEVVHLSHLSLIELLQIQTTCLKMGASLILPAHLLGMLDAFVERQTLEPSVSDVRTTLSQLLELG